MGEVYHNAPARQSFIMHTSRDDRLTALSRQNQPFCCSLSPRRVHITENWGTTSLNPDYLEHALELLSGKLSFALNHPLSVVIDSSPDKRVQDFFADDDPLLDSGTSRRFRKPVAYSPTVSSLVISRPDYIRVLESFYPNHDSLSTEDPLRNLTFYALNRLEFALHEYGHIVSANRGLSFIGDREELEDLKEEAYRSLRMIPDGYKREESIQLVKNILSDLKADVVRRDVALPLDSGRRIDALPVLGIEERVKEGGSKISPGLTMFRLLRMAAWKPVCIENSRLDLAETAQREIEYACEVHGRADFIPVVDKVTRYFIAFMQAHRFDCEGFISKLASQSSRCE
jgi:hypothetical protein